MAVSLVVVGIGGCGPSPYRASLLRMETIETGAGNCAVDWVPHQSGEPILVAGSDDGSAYLLRFGTDNDKNNEYKGHRGNLLVRFRPHTFCVLIVRRMTPSTFRNGTIY